MSLPSESPFVAPSGSRSRTTPLVLGGLAIVLLVLALIGLPLVPLPSRGGNEHQFATFGTEFGRWLHHSGWRYTSDSWAYWAGLTACLFGILAWWLRVRTFTRRYALVAVPAAAVLALGPLAQAAVGLRPSDYATRVTFGGNLPVSAAVIAGLLVFFYGAQQLRRFIRSASSGSSGNRRGPFAGR